MEGCLVWIVIFVIIMMLVIYGLAGTLTILLVLTVAVLLIGGVGMYFYSKYEDTKKREALSIRQEEERLRAKIMLEKANRLKLQNLEEERIQKQKKLEEEKQLLSLLEQSGGSRAVVEATSYLQSKSFSWEQRTNFLESYLLQILANKVNKEHVEVLQRKKKQGVYTDDYGRTISDKWSSDLVYYIKKVFLDELFRHCKGISGYPIQESKVFQNRVLFEEDENIKYWSDFIDKDLDRYEVQTKKNYSPDLSGHEYEHFVAGLIKLAGWAVLVTKGSGDHGADIIATLDNGRVAIQCKKYTSPVGNQSVQEVFSAAQFYDCAFGCVVSNTDFTPAARQAAAKLEVPLLHHDDVTDYFTTLKNKNEGYRIDDDNV